MSRPTRCRKETGFYAEDNKEWVRRDDELTLEEVSPLPSEGNIDAKRRNRLETLKSVMVSVLCSENMRVTGDITYKNRKLLSEASFPCMFSCFPSHLTELVVFKLNSRSFYMKDLSWSNHLLFKSLFLRSCHDSKHR